MTKKCLVCSTSYMTKSGRSKTCSEECRKVKDKLYNKRYLPEWKKKNPDKHKEQTLKWRYSEKCRQNQNKYHNNLRRTNIKVRLKGIWYAMQDRCKNPKTKAYKDYGGRGIKIEWLNFDSFYQDMIITYMSGLTIDRIDVNGNYSKINCRWIPKGEQALNRRNNIKVTLNGQPINSLELSKITGISRGIIYRNYKKNIHDYKK